MILLAANSQGYQNLCSLITLAHQGPLVLEQVLEHSGGIFLLTGPRWGFASQLLAHRQVAVLGPRRAVEVPILPLPTILPH